ncbi:uncharacterized protein EDB91DRAFT_1059927, partial [Suillus paluster]|uniref:uncharacterized protein n=1 Tax=Suillus paluster TaxID=48578 RepID=UPI001B87C233
PEGGGIFGAGRVTVSPAYFMQRHERIQDPLVTSASYSSAEVQEWLAALLTTEYFWNAITAASAPGLFEAGSTAISEVVQQVRRASKPDAVPPSIFSGLEVIANCVTFSHRDPGGAPSLFDLLVSLGSGHEAKLTLRDIGAELDYHPGTMVFISGKVLEHSIGPWIKGERIVIAHFMKDKVHSRVGVPRPAFPTQDFFLQMVGRQTKRE